MLVFFVFSEQGGVVFVEGLFEESICYYFSNFNWFIENNFVLCFLVNFFCNEIMFSEWGRNDLFFLWGGRIVVRRQVKGYGKGDCGLRGEEYDIFINIFEGGLILYCNMLFEVFLNVRKQLEELGFFCKVVNDGFWLQVWNFFLDFIVSVINVLKYYGDYYLIEKDFLLYIYSIFVNIVYENKVEF